MPHIGPNNYRVSVQFKQTMMARRKVIFYNNIEATVYSK